MTNDLSPISSFSPVDGVEIGKVGVTTEKEYQVVMKKAEEAFKMWRTVPAPKRGDMVRQFGDKLREKKEALGKLVSYEILSRRLGRSTRND